MNNETLTFFYYKTDSQPFLTINAQIENDIITINQDITNMHHIHGKPELFPKQEVFVNTDRFVYDDFGNKIGIIFPLTEDKTHRQQFYNVLYSYLDETDKIDKDHFQGFFQESQLESPQQFIYQAIYNYCKTNPDYLLEYAISDYQINYGLFEKQIKLYLNQLEYSELDKKYDTILKMIKQHPDLIHYFDNQSLINSIHINLDDSIVEKQQYYNSMYITFQKKGEFIEQLYKPNHTVLYQQTKELINEISQAYQEYIQIIENGEINQIKAAVQIRTIGELLRFHRVLKIQKKVP